MLEVSDSVNIFPHPLLKQRRELKNMSNHVTSRIYEFG